MQIREIGRRAHVALLIVVALGCVVMSIAVANLAWTWWGHPCACALGAPGLAPLCLDTCISIGPVSVSEGTGTLILGLALPPLGAAIAEYLVHRAETRSVPVSVVEVPDIAS